MRLKQTNKHQPGNQTETRKKALPADGMKTSLLTFFLLVFVPPSNTDDPETELIFFPHQHSLLVINSNVLLLARKLVKTFKNLTNDDSEACPLFKEVGLARADLTREALILKRILQPIALRSLRSKRSIWGFFGIASSSDLTPDQTAAHPCRPPRTTYLRSCECA